MSFVTSLVSKAFNWLKSRPSILTAIGAGLAAAGTFILGILTGKNMGKKKAEKEKLQLIETIKKHEAEIRRLEPLKISDRKKSKLIKKQQKAIDELTAKIEELEKQGV